MNDETIIENVNEMREEKIIEPGISKKHLFFYESLRKKLTSFVNKKTGAKGEVFTNYLLALPDFFMLLCRLMVDGRVTVGQKAFIAGIIGYVIFPLDIIPDFIPIIGFADDLVLVVYGLNFILNELDHVIIQDNWSGDENLIELLGKISATAENFLDRNVLKKIKKWLTKNKVEQKNEANDSL
ncbi:MAG: DUF1232 domain-containing protein [Candidatus Cloacimonetes bacterium]|nr:DUF1232 domain-containing protein [Candidatus Cloacimonadota bacterium]